MVKLRDQILENADLLLTDQEMNDIGPGVVVRRSRIILQLHAKSLMLIKDVKFIDCDITTKRELRDFLWHSAFLQGCRFHGRFLGNCFGQRLDGGSRNGGVERCDFSDAILDLCAFYGCDPASIVFPKWPGFTLLYPWKLGDEMTHLEWPGKLGRWAKIVTSYPHAKKVASTGYAPSMMKRYEVSEEELTQAISRLPNIIR
jgi:hypothetical protein